MTDISFEKRIALLVDHEVHWRGDRKRQRLMKLAHLNYPQAAIEDIDIRAGRGLECKPGMSGPGLNGLKRIFFLS